LALDSCTAERNDQLADLVVGDRVRVAWGEAAVEADDEHIGGREPAGFANSGGLLFVDQSAEQIASAEVSGRC
jgi:hypothetical protein